MRKIINVLLIILVFVAFYFVIFKPDWIVAGPPIRHNDATIIDSAKSDDITCTGHETVGRCADKCADPNAYLQGYDKETGAAICHNNAPVAAPTIQAPAPQIDSPSLPTFQGK